MAETRLDPPIFRQKVQRDNHSTTAPPSLKQEASSVEIRRENGGKREKTEKLENRGRDASFLLPSQRPPRARNFSPRLCSLYFPLPRLFSLYFPLPRLFSLYFPLPRLFSLYFPLPRLFSLYSPLPRLCSLYFDHQRSLCRGAESRGSAKTDLSGH